MDTAAADPLVHADNLSKRFFATRALDSVSVFFRPSEVHALIGENGAGKSTLIKILGGVFQPDGGHLIVGGQSCKFRNPREAMRAGIVVIPQEMRTVPAQTVAENVMLGNLPVHRLFGLPAAVNRTQMRQQANALLERLNLSSNPDAPISELGYAERQLVMIARALNHKARVLLLDEPTAALEASEVTRLFEVVRNLREDGVAIVFISHRLDEVDEIADVCTILRDGRVVGTAGAPVPPRNDMIRMMTGRDLEESHSGESASRASIALQINYRDAEVGDWDPVIVHAGQVLGIAGLLGSGVTEFLLRTFGMGRGQVRIQIKGHEEKIAGPSDAIGRGIGLVPNERSFGLIMGLTVRENIILPNLSRLSSAWKLDKAAIDRLVEDLLEAVDIRPRDPKKLVRELSGGNQQKVIFARWLAGNADALLLDEPTHGIDVGAKEQIHTLIRRFAADGGAVIFASSEMTELLANSDKVIAIKDGRIVAEIARADPSGNYNEGTLRAALGA